MSALAGSATHVTRRAPFSEALLQLGREREDVVVLSADLGRYTDVQPFADRYPDRYLQVGMAEQNLMGIAGGLAKTGLLPIAVTYGVFASRRAYDQLAMAMATGPSRGIVAAFLPGISTPFRATHQAIDDVSILRALPGLTIIDPADATEMAAATHAAVAHDGPVYIRGLRGDVAQLFDPEGFELRLGEARRLGARSDVGLVSSGLGTQWAMEAARVLDERGLTVSILHMPTLKPADAEAIAAFAAEFEVLTSIENHSVIGGLGSAVAEALAEAGAATRLRRLGVPDCWAPAGSLETIRRALALDAVGIADAVMAR